MDRKELGKVMAATVVGLLLLWWLIDALPLPEGVKATLQSRLSWAVAIAAAVALAAVGIVGAPWWVGVGGGALVLSGTAAGKLIGRIVKDHLDGTPGASIRCGDPGTCGEVIDGALCLHLNCEPQ